MFDCFPGEVEKNHDVLREAYSLCYRLPVLSTLRFKEDYYNVSALLLWECIAVVGVHCCSVSVSALL